MKKGFFLVWVLVLIAYFPWAANAQSAFSDQSWNFGFQAGFLFPGPGKIGIEDVGTYEIDPGFVFTSEIDGYVAPKLSMGLKYVLTSSSMSVTGRALTLHTVSATFKARFNAGEKMQIRPGFAIGYNRGEYNNMDGSNGMQIAPIVQVAYSLNKGKAIIGEFSFISQPVGGNGTYAITFPPIFYISAGLEFGN